MTVTAMPVVKAQKASMPWSTLEDGGGFLTWPNKKTTRKNAQQNQKRGFFPQRKNSFVLELLHLFFVGGCFRGVSLYNYSWIFHAVGGVEGMEPFKILFGGVKVTYSVPASKLQTRA